MFLDSEVKENLVKKTCEKLGINQKQLAEKTGIHPNSLSKWNKNNLIPKTARKTFEILLELEAYKKIVKESL